MRRPSARHALLGLSVLFFACDPDGGKETGAPATTPDGGEEDSADPDDSGTDTSSPEPDPLTVEAVRTVKPATLPEATGGAMAVTIRVQATDSSGSSVPLDTARLATNFAVLLSSGSEVSCSAEVSGDDTMVVSFDVPPDLARNVGARLEATLLIDGEAGPTFPVRLHTSPQPLLDQFAGDPTGRIAVEGGADTLGTVCDTIVVDADGDGRVEVLTVGVSDKGFRLTGCASSGEGEGTTWTCEDEAFDHERSSGGFICGNTDHFMVSGGGVGVFGAATDVEGQRIVFEGVGWDGSKWTGTPTGSVQSSAAQLAVVIGTNNTKEDPEVPLLEEMGVQGGSGAWTGYFDGPEGAWAWTALGSHTAEAIGEGKVHAGFSGDRGLWGTAGGTSYAWTLDASDSASGGKLLLDIFRPDASSKSIPRLRTVSLAAPGFTVEAAAGVFGDIDGDDAPELIVEVWGEGRWAAWVVPAATSKSDGRPVTLLSGGPEHNVAWIQDHLDAAGPVRTSFVLTGPDSDTLSALLPVFTGSGATATSPGDTAELLSVSRDLGWLSSGGSDLVHANDVFDEGRVHRGDPEEKRLGICCFGRCMSPPGYGGSSLVPSASGAGSAAWDLEAGARALVSLDPGGIVLAPASLGPPAPKGLIRSSELRPLVMGSSEGSTVLLDGDTPVFEASVAASVASTVDRELEPLVIFAFEPNAATADSRSDDSAQPATVRFDLRVRYADASSSQLVLPDDTTIEGTTAPVLLSDHASDEGGVLLGWRDGTGQAWLGVVDLALAVSDEADGVVPFLHGPTAVGAPLVDPDGILGLSSDSSGMVFLNQTPPEPTPFISMEDLEERFSDWDEPMEVPFAGGEGRYGSVAMLVGTASGGAETLYFPPVDAFDSLDPVQVVAESSISAATPVPRLAARLVADAPPVLVTATGEGQVDLLLIDQEGRRSFRSGVLRVDASRPLQAADLNGDGISDLVQAAGSASVVALSDGTGGWLESEVAAPLGFERVVAGGSPDQEAPLDVAGGRGLALGGPLVGPWDY